MACAAKRLRKQRRVVSGVHHCVLRAVHSVSLKSNEENKKDNDNDNDVRACR